MYFLRMFFLGLGVTIMLRHRKIHVVLAWASGFLFASSAAYAVRVVYVDTNATGSPPNGADWCHAYPELYEALAVVASGDTIRIADGTYTPDPTGLADPRDATFQLIDGVTIEGGYAGCGAPNPDQRDIVRYETVLSGDLNGDDEDSVDVSECCTAHPAPGCGDGACEEEVCTGGGGLERCCEVEWDEFCADVAEAICDIECRPNLIDNSYHVVTGSGTDASAILDGVTITAGFASHHAGEYTRIRGGGMLNISGSPTVRRCTFRRNAASGRGGGMLNDTSSNPLVIGCTFLANSVGPLGGGGVGMFNEYGSSPWVTDCVFISNRGASLSFGGGMGNLNESNPTVVRCIFRDNTATFGGGVLNDTYCASTFINCRFLGNTGEYYGGGMHNNSSSPTLVNCLFSGNRAAEGGAIANGGGVPDVVNCTLSQNTATEFAGGIHHFGQSEPTMTNSILWGNRDEQGGTGQIETDGVYPNLWIVNHSCLEGGWTGAGGVGNLDEDPLFIDPIGPDGIVGTPDDDLRLVDDSPCIDAGDDGAVPADEVDLDEDGDLTEPIPLDLDDHPRFSGERVDMGAYESGTASLLGDYDNDGDADLRDFALYQTCVYAPGVNPMVNPCVKPFDYDRNEFINLMDFGGLTDSIDGPGDRSSPR